MNDALILFIPLALLVFIIVVCDVPKKPKE